MNKNKCLIDWSGWKGETKRIESMIASMARINEWDYVPSFSCSFLGFRWKKAEESIRNLSFPWNIFRVFWEYCLTLTTALFLLSLLLFMLQITVLNAPIFRQFLNILIHSLRFVSSFIHVGLPFSHLVRDLFIANCLKWSRQLN